MKLRFALFLGFLAGLSGCAVLKVDQKDQTTTPTGEIRLVSTRVTGAAWFSSSQHFAKLKTTQTDKTQSIGADGLQQQGATNSVAALQAIARILEALPK